MYETSGSHPDIHWPSGFSPADAHSFHRAQAVVSGPPERSFRILTDVANWPNWVPGCEEVSSDTLTQTFEVVWAGHRFEVFVGESVPPRRIGWLGIGGGVMLYQAWLLTETQDGTEIVVENAVRADVPVLRGAMSDAWAERLNELWLAQLGKLSEYPPEENSTS
ncbi:SRPBCC family protein [Streptomyces sp. NPDC005483]|uniref:SRPBCC family protein n=1 Tax=Streptomyces sp. NPDC005483 TaxID=3154882 RepID=UPI0033AEA4AF